MTDQGIANDVEQLAEELAWQEAEQKQEVRKNNQPQNC